jgi:hypothetical protein
VARRVPRPTTRGWLIAAAAAFLAVIGGVFGIIRISTPEGDYVIYTDDPNFSFSVSRGGVTLRDKKADREYTLKVVRHENGTFELDVSDVGAELSFKTKELTIKRGQQVALKAWFERKHVADVRPSPDDRFALRFDEKSRWDPVPVPLELSQPFTVEGYFTVEAGGGWLFHADSQINLNSRRSTWSFHLRGQKKGSWTSNHVSFAAASNRKTHVACVYTGKEILLFLDGKLVASGNAEKDPPHPGRVALTIVNGWQGIVEEVRISQAARYQKDFTPKQRFEADAATLAQLGRGIRRLAGG